LTDTIFINRSIFLNYVFLSLTSQMKSFSLGVSLRHAETS
jgi:hypothetical protein